MLMNDPYVTGHVIVYGPGGEAGGSGASRLRVTEDYLVNQRGIDAGRIEAVYGGPFKSLKESATELWIVPPGAAAPEPSRYENDADTFTGKLAEVGAWDGLDYGEATGPPVGDVTAAALADMLRSRPDTRAYLVVYHGEDSTLGLWRRVGAREAETLLRGAAVKEDRVEVIFGGYRDEAVVERWLLPADAPPPALMAEETRRPTEAVQLGTFHSFVLKYEEDARWVFKGFADVLREDEHMRAFVIVRPEMGATVNEWEDASAPPPEAPPEIDLVRLAEQWQKSFVNEYGLGAERLVVIVAPASDGDEAGQVEVWLVPPGAAPPDPYAEEEVEETEEEAGEPDGEDDEPAEADPAS
jgi:hypothetical protein